MRTRALSKAGEQVGTRWGTVNVEGLEEAGEMGEDRDAYEPVTNLVTKWLIKWGKFCKQNHQGKNGDVLDV